MQTYVAIDKSSHEVLCFFNATDTSDALKKAMYFNPTVNACYLTVFPYENAICKTGDTEYHKTEYSLSCQ